MMKKLIALLLALLLTACAAFASEAPPVPQEAKSPAQLLIDKLRSNHKQDTEAPKETAETRPPVEITKVTGKGDQITITFRNNLDIPVSDIIFTLLTLNEDGTLATKANTTNILEIYQHSHSYSWILQATIQPGKTQKTSGMFDLDTIGIPTHYISVKEYPVVAAGIKSYITGDGTSVLLASDQMTFVGTDGRVIPPVNDDLTPVTFTDEELALIKDLSFGMTSWFVPAYSADFFGVPAGEYVERVLTASIPKNAGLRKGDIILSYGDITAGRPYAQEICQLMLANGEEVPVTYWRHGEIKTTTLIPPAR